MPDDRFSGQVETGGGDDLPLTFGGRHRTYRRLFREMIKFELRDRPLGWLQGRALIRFARRLGLDDLEARLLIRAVEYESGHAAPTSPADGVFHQERHRSADSESGGLFLDRNLFWPAAFGVFVLLVWLLR